METTPKIYNYARVSTTKQLQGVGLETQQQKSILENLSLEYGLPIHDENFVDHGVSAYHGKHKEGALGIVLSRIESGEIPTGSILVVFSLDRLSRETVNVAMEQLLRIINQGVRVYTHIDGKLFDAKSQHLTADLIVSLITMQRANEESETKSKRTIAASKIALKRWKETCQPQGALGRTPFWIDQRTNTFNINAEGVKKAIEMRITGYGDLKIKQYLDANFEYKPTRRKGKIKQSDSWDYIAISQLWGKRSLIGEKTFTIEGVPHVMENYYPPLIDDSTFLKLQICKNKKQGRDTGSGKIALLKGIARCGICGGAMVFMDKGGDRVSYVCNLALKGEHDRELYNANMLDFLTLEICKDTYLTVSDNTDNISEEHEKLQLEIELSAEQENRDKLFEISLRTPKDSFFKLLENSENKIDKLKAKLDALENDNIVLNADELASLQEVFDDDIRTNYLHPERYVIRNNLYRFISSITLSRRFEPCCDAKTKFANCVDITWHFKNGQKRRLAMLPYEYTKAKSGSKGLYLPFMYIYGSKNFIDVKDGEQLLSDILKKLHELDLTKSLYPSKGQYKWNQRSLECGNTYGVPLDEASFLDPETRLFEFGGMNTEKTTSLNYISMMYNHQWKGEKLAYDYPLSKFNNLARRFNLVESEKFLEFLQDNRFDQELYLSLDFLMS
ncbi:MULTISPECIES: recombinase family protein [Photobacterium]|uniref:recombinase family protein n=1 Tax=Photobacterium TaxID=657 RepID=UPI00136C9CD7|nr:MULTISPECIES: recombinase family protein [Photobacterium]MBP2698731.1 recombinase family protein [Vibrio parahaemolyticus]MZG57647.1 recombinase family protein [Photobacterium lucens]MZG79466.1 recombinase family protein [Photobacterium lucens]